MGHKTSFTTTKDRVWSAYAVLAGWLARQPQLVRKLGYGLFGLALWIAYLLPGNLVRPTFAALAKQTKAGNPLRLFARYVREFCRGINRLEQVRHGRTDAIDRIFRIPEEQRFRTLTAERGCILVLPHTQAGFPMGRGFSARYPLLALVRSATDKRRAAAEWEVYQHLDAEVLDVRVEQQTTVARKVLGTLRQGKLVLGVVDRIRTAPPPEAPVDPTTDTVRATAFGQPVGITGWPARFARKAGAPILPAMVVQTKDAISLHIGAAIEPGVDLVATTQAWLTEMERLIREYPEEWTFALDKHWSRVLRADAES